MAYKYFVTAHTGYFGSTMHDVFETQEKLSQEEMDNIAWEMAVDNAASFGYELCPEGDDCEDDECEFEHLGITGIEGYMVPYVAEEHDMYL